MEAADPRHSILFESVKIGPKIARNRFFAAAHSLGMGYSQPHSTAALRAMKAEGGWAVVCTGVVEIDETSDMMGHQNDRLWDDHDVACHRLATDAIHEHGALAAVELAHLGVGARNLYSRVPTLGPDSLKCTSSYVPTQSRGMSQADIGVFRRAHRAAVLRAVDAGYDVIYIYAAHDRALPMHFLSRRYNQRTDGYGGSIENRMRLLRELIEDTSEAVAGRCAVAVRFAVHDFSGSISVEDEGKPVLEALGELPDLWDVNISPWQHDSGTARFDVEGWQESYVGFVKSMTTKPVVGVGRFTSVDTMVSQIKRGILDFIGAARPSIADPFLPEKIRSGRVEEIRECIGCNFCASTEMYGVPIRCTQNPTIGEEWRKGWHPELIPSHRSNESAMVVGAGPAGLEAALTLARRGLHVSLVDELNELGGRLLWETRLPGLASYGRVRDYRAYHLERMANVDIILGSKVNADEILEFGADRIFLATGSNWRLDGVGPASPFGIPGLQTAPKDWLQSPTGIVARVQRGEAISGPVVVYDDDHYYLGYSIAQMLSSLGLEVIIVTPLAELSQWSYYTLELRRIEKAIQGAGITVLTKSRIAEVRGRQLRLTCDSDERWRSIGLLVTVTLRAPSTRLYDDLHARDGSWAEKGIRSVELIGDALALGTVAAAVYSGSLLARELGADRPGYIRRERVLLDGQ